MKKYDAVLFDLDGTLLNTLEDLTDATNAALTSFGMPSRTIDEVRRFVGNGARRLMELSMPDGFANPQFEEVFAAFKEHYGLYCNEKTRPYDGVMELLRGLKREGYQLAIVSNKPDFAVKELAEIYFEGIIAAATGEKEGVAKKPAPDTVRAALGELGVDAERALYVGDSDVDVMTAKNAGMKCVSVLWGFRDEAFLREYGAEHFVHTPAELWEYLE